MGTFVRELNIISQVTNIFILTDPPSLPLVRSLSRGSPVLLSVT